MWKCGFLLLLLLYSFSVKAVPDSLLYPKAQLDAFKGRVAAAKKYADTATVLFRSVAQAVSLKFYKDGAMLPALTSAFSAGKPLSQIGELQNGARDTFLLLRQRTQDTFNVKYKESYAISYADQGYRYGADESATTSYRTVPVKQSPELWLYKTEHKTRSNFTALSAFYTFSSLQSEMLPHQYSRAIHYFHQLAGKHIPDCFVAQKEPDNNAKSPYWKALTDYTEHIAPRPAYIPNPYVADDLSAEEHQQFIRNYKTWLTSRWKPLDSAYTVDSVFKKLLRNAVEEALKTNKVPKELPELVAHYGYAQTALRLNCHRFAYTVGCGNDFYGRLRYLETALFAAAADEWPTFFWAHMTLGIVDDAQSGKESLLYDWDNRIAYTRELEYLGIDVPQLVLGMALKVQTEPLYDRFILQKVIHNICIESSNPKAIEQTFALAASDNLLDLYNRLTCYWFLAYHFQDARLETQSAENAEILKRIAATLPHWSTLAEKF